MIGINNYILEKLHINKDTNLDYEHKIIAAIKKMIDEASKFIHNGSEGIELIPDKDYTIDYEYLTDDPKYNILFTVTFKIFLTGQERYEIGNHMKDIFSRIKDGHDYEVFQARIIKIYVKK